jgi:hypothetical protein
MTASKFPGLFVRAADRATGAGQVGHLPDTACTQFKLNFPVSMVSRSNVPTSTTVS